MKAWAVSVLGLVAAVVSPGCAVARPFATGPAGPASEGAIVTLVITHAVLDNDERERFDHYTRAIVRALDSGEVQGLVGFSVRKELFGNEVWTMTAWSDPQALERFARSKLHQEAIAGASPAIRTLRVRRLKVAATDVPLDWNVALRRLEEPERP